MEKTNQDIESTVIKKALVMPKLPNMLSLEEKKYLLAVERGDLPNVRRTLQMANKKKISIDINCMDSLGRGALTIAIDQENLEMVELLVIMGVQTKDSLLHAINVEFVEAVELLLEHEELIHVDGEPYSWQKVDINTAMFTPDLTPLILAAHRNNYEILKILLDRGATVPMPHDIKCGCDECIRQTEEDSLRHSLSRLNEYRALASPSLIALSSSDPLLTAFQLSWELRNLAFAEPECKSEYMDLRQQCQRFAVDLLHQSRSSQELAIILNHDPDNPPYEEGEHMKLARLELAIQYKQKKFVSHPNIQQLLAAIWYEGVPGFRRKSSFAKLMIILRVALLFPFYCMFYMFLPETKTGKLMRKPFMKFLIHASSYLFFLLLLILVSLRADDLVLEYFGSESMKTYVIEKYNMQRGNPPTILEYAVLIYVVGFIFEETQEIFNEGINSYLRNMWNFIDFTRNVLYAAVFILRVASYLQQGAEIRKEPSRAFIRREEWNAFDPQLIAEGLFAAANILSALKLVHLFSINPHLGPLQISLGRMVIDIVKFFFIYSLVLFAFACGLNQLLWYFSDLEKKKCHHLPGDEPDFDGEAEACMKWRRFANVFESSQSLFWASFGMVDLDSFELTGIKTYTRFWGLLMFGSYSVINVIVLLNLLIAMMSNSYAMIDEHSDTEWKFARTKLWMSYFEETGTLPPPFNIFPKPKNIFKLFGLRKKDKLRRMSSKRRNREEKERDYRYTAVMRALVWRYVSAMHRKCEESAVTEDDINEVKSDISSFRYEILEVLSKNGMDVSSAERKEKAVLGKKMKVWERRLMKDFKVAPVASEEDEEIFGPPPANETSLARFRRIAKLAAMDSAANRFRQVVKGAQIASQIGRSVTKEGVKKQQNLQKAMDEAKRITASRSPENFSRVPTPIVLPDLTGADIVDLLHEGTTPDPTRKDLDRTSSSRPAQGPSSSGIIFLDPPASAVKPKKNTIVSPVSCMGGPNAASKLSPKDEPDLINLDSTKTYPVKQTEEEGKITSPPIIVSPPPVEDSSDSPSKESMGSIDSYVHPRHYSDDDEFHDSLGTLGDTEEEIDEKKCDYTKQLLVEATQDSELSDSKSLSPAPGQKESIHDALSTPEESPGKSPTKKSAAESPTTEKDSFSKEKSPTPPLESPPPSTPSVSQKHATISPKKSPTPEPPSTPAESPGKSPITESAAESPTTEKDSSSKKKSPTPPLESPPPSTPSVSQKHATISPKQSPTPEPDQKTSSTPTPDSVAGTSKELTLPHSHSASRSPVTTPMSQRNIKKVHDTKRIQPKYGWL